MDIKIKLKKLENFCNFLLEAINNLTKAHNTCMEKIEKIVNKMDKSINDTNDKINNLEDRLKHLEEYLESNYNKLNENFTYLENKIKNIENNIDVKDSINTSQYNEFIELKDKVKTIEDDANSAYNTINYNFEIDGKDIKRVSDTIDFINSEIDMLKFEIKELQEKNNG